MTGEQDLSTVLVIGATGNQGYSVCDHLLNSKKYKIRFLTRNKHGNKARSLIKRGCVAYEGNLSDPNRIPLKMFENVDYVFVNTMYQMDKEGPEVEVVKGTNLGNILKKYKNDIKAILFSSIPFMKGSDEAYAKHKIESLFNEYDLPLITLYPTFYMENYTTLWVWTRNLFSRKLNFWMLPMNDYELTMNTDMPHFSVRDMGGIVLGVINSPKRLEELMNKKLFVASDIVTPKQVCQIFEKNCGESFSYKPLNKKQFNNLPFPKRVLEALYYYGNTHEFSTKEKLEQITEKVKQDMKICYELYPNMITIDKWSQNEDIKNKLLHGDRGKSLDYKRMGLAWIKRYTIAKTFLTRRDTLITMFSLVGAGIGIYRYFNQNGNDKN